MNDRKSLDKCNAGFESISDSGKGEKVFFYEFIRKGEHELSVSIPAIY